MTSAATHLSPVESCRASLKVKTKNQKKLTHITGGENVGNTKFDCNPKVKRLAKVILLSFDPHSINSDLSWEKYD